MNAKELKEAQAKIEEEIYSIAKEKSLSNENIAPITDGVCDFEAYLSSKPRVMWILKEPYDDYIDGKPVGGGWSIATDSFIKESTLKIKTDQMVVYTMYGYKHGIPYSGLPYISEKPEMGEVLKEICWINLSKMPAGTRSSDAVVAQNFLEIWKDIVKKQIALYDPEVIIFAGRQLRNDAVYYEFLNDEDWANHKEIKKGNRIYINKFIKDGRLILDTYHPGLRNGLEFYSNSIMKAIDEFMSTK